MKKPILFIFIVLTFQAAVGQSTLSQQLTGSGGGQTDNATFKTSWSVGEAVTATASAGSYTLTQGFHQNQLLFPATQAYNIVFSNVQTTQMQADWTRGTGTKCAVFMKQASTGTSFPANNITYTANTSFTAGTQIGSTGWYCVYNDVGTNVTITNLAAGATYIMHVCEYNGTAGSEQYNTSLATDNPKSQTTGGSSDIQAHDISFSNILPVSLRADWTRGNGVQCVVFVKQGSSGTALPANNTIYNPNAAFSSGTQIGSSGWYCVYNGTGTYVTFTNLSPGTDYIVQVFEYTGSPGSEQYDISTATNNPNAQATTGTPPTQAHNIVFTNVLPTSMQADWTRGNGANCAVFVKQASSGLATPSDNTTYTGNASFVSGTQIGSSGWYCVYNGTATTVTVTDITPGLAYLMHVCEYNAPPGSEQYNTSTASGNPNSPILNGLSGTIEAFTDVTCNTAGNGTITISASGGYGTFEYSSDGSTWVGGPGSPYVFTGLTPGTYHMWIRDAVNTASELFLNDQIITQPDVLAELSSTHTNVSCFNGNNGTVTVAATGGTPAYVYSLLPGSHGDGTSSGVFTGLTAGTYTYSMTDANSCGPVTGKLVVTEPTQIGGTSNIDTYVSCEGLCDGIVIVTATGGTSPYRYALNGASWSLLTVSPYVFTDLCATTYTAHIMDNNGCTGDVVFTMVQSYYGPKAQFGTPDPTCVGQKVCIAVQGRDMYVSSPDPNHPDALVCAISLKFQYDPSVMTLLPFDVGTWNPSIPWTDHVGFGYNSLNVTNTLVSTHVALIRIGGFGDSFGFGTSGLGTLVNLCFTYHGQYNVLGDALTWVDDGNNKTECEFAYFVTGVGSVKYCDLPNDHYYFPGTVSGPTLALANANGSPSHTDDNCYGGYGTITLQASGGTTPYHYTLNPGPLTSGAQPGAYTFTGLVARTYTYSITDAHDCGPVTGTLDVTQSDPLLCSTGHTDVTCNPTPDGTITVYASGGFGTYNYSKDNGGTFEGGTGNSYTFTGLAQGTYSIAIRDAAHTACVHQCGVTDITQPPLLSVTTSSDQTVCQGTTFTVSVSVTGGTGPYSYHWEDPLPSATIYDNAGAITGTASFSPHNGTWHVTVTDSHSCTISGTAKLTVTL
ncbi:MAG: SprB repeat-containing protein, partial [Bacteroidetes bacterium]|nr:SprB repeat-containing protein [Bacteroidota bacterium]